MNEKIIEYKKRAQNGDLHAIFALGKMYYLEGDIDQAIQYLDRACDKGHLDAAIYLGEIYCFGKGGDTDVTLAFYYFNQAFAKEHPCAINCLGVMYYFGLGSPANREKGVSYFKQAPVHTCLTNVCCVGENADLGIEQVIQNCISLLEKDEYIAKQLLNALRKQLGNKEYNVLYKKTKQKQANNIFSDKAIVKEVIVDQTEEKQSDIIPSSEKQTNTIIPSIYTDTGKKQGAQQPGIKDSHKVEIPKIQTSEKPDVQSKDTINETDAQPSLQTSIQEKLRQTEITKPKQSKVEAHPPTNSKAQGSVTKRKLEQPRSKTLSTSEVQAQNTDILKSGINEGKNNDTFIADYLEQIHQLQNDIRSRLQHVEEAFDMDEQSNYERAIIKRDSNLQAYYMTLRQHLIENFIAALVLASGKVANASDGFDHLVKGVTTIGSLVGVNIIMELFNLAAEEVNDIKKLRAMKQQSALLGTPQRAAQLSERCSRRLTLFKSSEICNPQPEKPVRGIFKRLKATTIQAWRAGQRQWYKVISGTEPTEVQFMAIDDAAIIITSEVTGRSADPSLQRDIDDLVAIFIKEVTGKQYTIPCMPKGDDTLMEVKKHEKLQKLRKQRSNSKVPANLLQEIEEKTPKIPAVNVQFQARNTTKQVKPEKKQSEKRCSVPTRDIKQAQFNRNERLIEKYDLDDIINEEIDILFMCREEFAYLSNEHFSYFQMYFHFYLAELLLKSFAIHFGTKLRNEKRFKEQSEKYQDYKQVGNVTLNLSHTEYRCIADFFKPLDSSKSWRDQFSRHEIGEIIITIRSVTINVAKLLTQQYSDQLNRLTQSGLQQLSDAGIERIYRHIQKHVNNSHTLEYTKKGKLVNDLVISFKQGEGGSLSLDTSDPENDVAWMADQLIETCDIETPSGKYFKYRYYADRGIANKYGSREAEENEAYEALHNYIEQAKIPRRTLSAVAYQGSMFNKPDDKGIVNKQSGSDKDIRCYQFNASCIVS